MIAMKKLFVMAATAAALLGSAAHASTLVGALTADNEYNAYISTSDSTLGALLAAGTNWPSAQTFSTNLAAGQTYYLHVVANNFYGPGDMAAGNPDALLGSFSLSDTQHHFANGLQTLTTDTVNWSASPNAVVQNLNGALSWTAPTGTPISFATNGTGIWGGPVGGVSHSAQWIWSSTDPSGEAMFSTKIAAAVPEPSTWALMMGGLALVGLALRHRRSAAPAGAVTA